MDAEQELREYQREYLDFLDDGVSNLISPLICKVSCDCRHSCKLTLSVWHSSGRPRGVPGTCTRIDTLQLTPSHCEYQ